MNTKLTALFAVLVALEYGSGLYAQDIEPSRIPDGDYWIELMAEMKNAKEPIKSKLAVTAVTKGGVVAFTNKQQKQFPIIGKIANGVFTGKLDDAGGIVHFFGKLEQGIIKGTIQGTSDDKKETMQGTFTILPKKPDQENA